MAATGSVKIKVECLVDGKVSNHQQTFAPSDLVSTVIQASATTFGLNASGWNLCKDQGRTDVLIPSTSLESNGLKAAHKLWLGKVKAPAAHLVSRMLDLICFSFPSLLDWG